MNPAPTLRGGRAATSPALALALARASIAQDPRLLSIPGAREHVERVRSAAAAIIHQVCRGFLRPIALRRAYPAPILRTSAAAPARRAAVRPRDRSSTDVAVLIETHPFQLAVTVVATFRSAPCSSEQPRSPRRGPAPQRTSAPSGRARFPSRSRPRRDPAEPFTASALPGAAAVISAVVPLDFTDLASAPAFSMRLDHGGVAVGAGHEQRRDCAFARGRLSRSRPRRAAVSPFRDRRLYAAQCSAVDPSPCARVHVGFLLQQRSNRVADSRSWPRRPDECRWRPPTAHAVAARHKYANPNSAHVSALARSRFLRCCRRSVSTFTPSLCSMVSRTFAIGVPSVSAHVQIALQLLRWRGPQEHRHALVVVDVGIAHRAAVQHHRMVQQIAVAVRRVLQLLEEIRQQARRDSG